MQSHPRYKEEVLECKRFDFETRDVKENERHMKQMKNGIEIQIGKSYERNKRLNI